MKNKIFPILLLVAISINAVSQRDANLYFLPSVQSTKLNPAITPDAKIVLGLPGLSGFGLDLTNQFKASDLFVAKGDSFQFDFNSLLGSLDETGNSLNIKTDIDLFRLGVKFGPDDKKSMLTFNVTEKILIDLGYPQSLFEFLGSGSSNASDFLEISLSDLNLDVTHLREYGLTYSKDLNEKLNFGLGLKMLYGKGNLSTEKTNLNITSSVTEGLTASNDILINAAGLDSTTSNDPLAYIQNTNNAGFAVDLGATYQANEKLELSLSILNIGGTINWKSGVQSIGANNSFTFEGVDLTADSLNIEASLDSLIDVFTFDTIPATSYTTTIPAKIYLGAKYDITEKLKAGGLFYLEMGESTRAAISLLGELKVSRLLALTLSYSAYNKSYTNIGAGIVLNGGPFQLYFTTDNIFSFDLVGAKNANLRFGTNFQFGRTDKKKKEKK